MACREEIGIYKYRNFKRRGLSLIELLVSIGLMGIVILILFSIYLNSNKIFNKTTNQSSNQQDVRLVADYITREIRSAKIISINENDVKKDNNKYYALTYKIDSNDNKKYLYKKSIDTSTGSTEIKIGNSLNALKFLPASKNGMVKMSITDDEENQSYNLVFELSLDNINDVVIPTADTQGVETIYYAKLKE
jgi:prepilin-type N-terminal cleavage/methylation domain-containing protein